MKRNAKSLEAALEAAYREQERLEGEDIQQGTDESFAAYEASWDNVRAAKKTIADFYSGSVR
jgi:hypothetical protein